LTCHQPDRRALDEAVFDVLGLTAGEREAVYEAVINLVRAAGEGTERVTQNV
jgi:mono/diheme cytochrome c family protein